MSKQALDLLQTIGFLDKNDRITDLGRFSEDDLPKLVAYYVEARRKTIEAEFAQLNPTQGLSALVSSFSGRTAVLPLLPSALVFEKLLVDDLLFKLHREDHHLARAHRESLGFAAEVKLEHWRVENALAFFEHLAPLMRHRIVHSLPLADLHKAPKEPVINFSEDWYRSDVPDAVHDFVHQNVIIREMQPGPNGKGLRVLHRAPTKPVRGVMLSFLNDDINSEGTFYLLHEMRMLEKRSETEFLLAQTLPWDKPPDEAQYQAWLYQSVNQTIAARLHSISAEMGVADAARAAYLTESAFEAQLCAKLGVKDGRGSSSADAINFLRANEPTLCIETADAVLRLRTGNSQMFEQFHRTLLEVSQQLHGAENFEERAKGLLAKEIMPQVQAIETAGAKLRGGIEGGAAIAGGSLALALLSGPALPLAAVLGVGAILTGGAALPSVTEYLSVRKTPAFLWKQIIKVK